MAAAADDWTLALALTVTLTLKGMSDERQNRPILSADKIARQKSVMCHTKIARFCRPTKSPNFVGQDVGACRCDAPVLGPCRLTIQILSSMILLADFSYVAQQTLLCCHGDCLQRKMNIYFSYLLVRLEAIACGADFSFSPDVLFIFFSFVNARSLRCVGRPA